MGPNREVPDGPVEVELVARQRDQVIHTVISDDGSQAILGLHIHRDFQIDLRLSESLTSMNV